MTMPDLISEPCQGLNHGLAASLSSDLSIRPSHLCEDPPRVHGHHQDTSADQVHGHGLHGHVEG